MHESKMGATTFSRETFSITLKSVTLSLTEITTARCHFADYSMPHVIYAEYSVFCYAECRCAECRCAECRFADCRGAIK